MKRLLLAMVMCSQVAFGNFYQLGNDIDGTSSWLQSGYSVSLSPDGSIAAIGDRNAGENSGRIRLYEWNNSSWNQLGNDIDGEYEWDQCGYSVSLSADGYVVAIGAPYNDGNANNSGHVRLYQWDGTSWNQLGNDINGEHESDLSGFSVSLSADGSITAIGAPYNAGNGGFSGHVRLYQWDGTSWSQLGNDIDGKDSNYRSGWSVSLSADGSIVAIGAPYGPYQNGLVRLYEWDGFSWNQLGNDIIGEYIGDSFGWSLSLSADGSVVAIGAPFNNGNGSDSGHVRLYEWDGFSWNQLGSDIDGEHSYNESGSSVSLSSDGTIVAIGAPFNNGNGSDSGHVRLYGWNGSSWNQLGNDIDGEASGDNSGHSVSLSADGTIVAIGAPFNDDGNGSDSGHVRFYLQSSDSDSDGLSDYHETNTHSTDPNDADSDNDGLSDSDEVNTHSTDPNIADTDEDGVNDGDEVTMGTSPFIVNVKPVLDLDSFYEAQSGQSIIVDAIPIDGYPADYTYQWIHNGYPIPLLFGGAERTYTLLGDASYNGNWSVIAGNSMGFDTNSFIFEVFVDTDLDGLSDGRETYVTLTSPNDSDSDDDGLSDGDELNTYLTNPNNTDSDGDGFDDGIEVAENWNPISNGESWVIDYINDRPDVFDISSTYNITNTIMHIATNTFTHITTNTITNAVGYTLSEVADMRYGSKNISVDPNGMAYLDFAIDSSMDLNNEWTKLAEITVPIDIGTNEVGFFRIRGEDQISTNEPPSYFEDFTETIFMNPLESGDFGESDSTAN